MKYLRVGDGSLAYRTPVDDAGPFINISFVVQLNKYLLDCLGTALVHGKPLPVPVAGDAHLL